MIVSFLLTTGSFVANIIIEVLSSLVGSLLGAIPQINQIVTWMITPLLYFGGIFNLTALFGAVTLVLNFFIVLYSFKIFFWVIKTTPYIGKFIQPISGRFFDTASNLQITDRYPYKETYSASYKGQWKDKKTGQMREGIVTKRGLQ